MGQKIEAWAEIITKFLSNGTGEIIVIPIALLVLAMLVKYWIGTKCSDIEWVNFILEFPIELLTIIASVLISVDILSANRDDKAKIMMAMIYLIITLIVLVISCFLRRRIIELMLKKNNIWLLYVRGIVIYVIAFGWVFAMIKISF